MFRERGNKCVYCVYFYHTDYIILHLRRFDINGIILNKDNPTSSLSLFISDGGNRECCQYLVVVTSSVSY